jgi:hypothetical protein
MIVLTNNGEALNAPAGFHPDPQSETGPVGGPVSSTEGNHPKKPSDGQIVSDSQRQRKAYVTMQAEFARVGFELKSKQHPAGVTLFEVSRHGQTRIFSHWGDVGAFLTQLQGGAKP